jgi:small subunit ribosomal protein S17
MPKRELIGTVVSDKMSKTIIVSVATHVPHPKYGKMVLRTRKFFAHDELELASMGAKVRIIEHRPLSRQKRWLLTEVIASQEIV